MEMVKQHDPVHQDSSGLWFFYDETWRDTDQYGPFDTESLARIALKKYCHHLDTGDLELGIL